MFDLIEQDGFAGATWLDERDQERALRTRLRHFRLIRRATLGGAGVLTDEEMLEILLFRTLPLCDIRTIAQRLLRRFGSFRAVLRANVVTLETVEGVDRTSAALLCLVAEAAERLARTEVIDRPLLSSWRQLIRYLRIRMTHHDIERFHILFLDTNNRLIADEEQQHGTVNHTPLYVREVIKRALELGASALILVHNHPSGNPAPSNDDIRITHEVGNAAAALGIRLHDHVIVAKAGHVSFKEAGLL